MYRRIIWTEEYDSRLLEMKAAGESEIVIAAALKRRVVSIEQRLYLLR
jgi:hypothetical protein